MKKIYVIVLDYGNDGIEILKAYISKDKARKTGYELKRKYGHLGDMYYIGVRIEDTEDE